MEVKSNHPDRINISKKAREYVEKIDEAKYFGLNDTAISRSELFSFAMAIGADTVPTKLENIYPGGLILDKSIDSCAKALIYALFIDKLGNDNLDEITKKDAVYSLAQEYANTGFEVIADYMDRAKDSDLIWELLEELESQYNKTFKNERSEVD